VIGAIVVLVLIGATTAIVIVRRDSTKPAATILHNCVPSGCALVSQSLPAIQPTGFFGASCTGVYGSWFLKIMEEGAGNQLRPVYYLRWQFTPTSPIARPSGRIIIPVSSAGVTLTLDRGKLTLKGTGQSNVRTVAAGTLTVRLSGTSTTPTLKFVETGLLKAESSVGLNSPFDAKGQPLTLLIRKVKVMVGC
jgi:hypothetical protein